jgi:hypothetical protein
MSCAVAVTVTRARPRAAIPIVFFIVNTVDDVS